VERNRWIAGRDQKSERTEYGHYKKTEKSPSIEKRSGKNWCFLLGQGKHRTEKSIREIAKVE